MSLAAQLSYRAITKMEDSFRREELKGQRHQQKDDGIDGAFAL